MKRELDIPHISNSRGLNARQLEFCRRYSDGPTKGNATRSYIEAGYSASSGASQSGAKLLGLPQIQRELQRLQRKAEKSVVLSMAQRMEILSQIGSGQISETITDYAGRVTTKNSPNTRISGIQELNRMTGAYPKEDLLQLEAGPSAWNVRINVVPEEKAPEPKEAEVIDAGQPGGNGKKKPGNGSKGPWQVE